MKYKYKVGQRIILGECEEGHRTWEFGIAPVGTMGKVIRNQQPRGLIFLLPNYNLVQISWDDFPDPPEDDDGIRGWFIDEKYLLPCADDPIDSLMLRMGYKVKKKRKKKKT